MEDFGPADMYLGASFASINGPMKRTLPSFKMDSMVASAIGMIRKASPEVKTMWSIFDSAAANFRTVSRFYSMESGWDRSQTWPTTLEAEFG